MENAPSFRSLEARQIIWHVKSDVSLPLWNKRCLETALKETSGLMLYYRPELIFVMVILGLVKITLELYEA